MVMIVTMVVLYKFLWIAKLEGGRCEICQAFLFELQFLISGIGFYQKWAIKHVRLLNVGRPCSCGISRKI